MVNAKREHPFLCLGNFSLEGMFSAFIGLSRLLGSARIINTEVTPKTTYLCIILLNWQVGFYNGTGVRLLVFTLLNVNLNLTPSKPSY